ncbi:MAG: 50S ribosomal protein L23 [Candidatus Makaraimicrobium thalassicum]|nr:MAG: 50S ribosomal protein L23 [Candidatus Omnitrophota bacterium]
MKTPHDIIKNMIRTEKGSDLLTQNKYLFRVEKRANKIEVKKAVEHIYRVKVNAVHIMNIKGKKRRVRVREGTTSSWKKAIVTLSPDNRIEVT